VFLSNLKINYAWRKKASRKRVDNGEKGKLNFKELDRKKSCEAHL
jgi:hypothetical protein